jgi:indole-3-glycerol phosphate synthase
MGNDILAKIYQDKLIEVRNAKKSMSLTEICNIISCKTLASANSVVNCSGQGLFFDRLWQFKEQKKIAIICEAKKASPSKGVIRADFNLESIISSFENAGAACISILTDEKYFMGSNQYLLHATKITTIPLLRKDFIVDEYQIYQAKMLGASAILLIVAMFTNDIEKIKRLEEVAFSIGLSVLVEVHDMEELKIAKEMQSKIIGINNRNLKTMKVDISTSVNLRKFIDDSYIAVAESGIDSKKDLEMLKEAGFNTFLIGEYFMKKDDIALAVKELIAH